MPLSAHLTDNVSLAPPGQERGTWCWDLPSRSASATKVRTVKLRQTTPRRSEYARSRDSNNLQNNLHSLMTVQAVDNFSSVDAIANMDES